VVGYFLILRPRPELVLSSYLAWYLNEEPTRAYLRNTAAQGSHMPIVNRAAFEGLEVPLPPLRIQAAIAGLDAGCRHEARLLKRFAEVRRKQTSAITLREANRHAARR